MTYNAELPYPYLLDKNYQEITSAVESGINPVVIAVYDETETELFTTETELFTVASYSHNASQDYFTMLLVGNPEPSDRYYFETDSATATLSGYFLE